MAQSIPLRRLSTTASLGSAADPASEALAAWLAQASTLAAGRPLGPLAAAVRTAGCQRLQLLGWPHKRDEVFKYNNLQVLQPFAQTGTDPAVKPAALPAVLPPALCGSASPRLVFYNGAYAAAASSAASDLTAAGIQVTALPAALAQPSATLRRHLEGGASPEQSTAAGVLPALNDAFLQDGVFVELAADARMEAPLEILWLASAAAQPQLHHPRLIVVGGAHSQTCLLERFVGTAAEGAPVPTGTNAVTQLIVEQGADMAHTVVQQQDARAIHAAHVEATVGRDAKLRSFVLSAGAAHSRHAIRARLQAAGAEVALSGLYLGRGAQRHAVHIQVEHAHPHGRSTQVFKGILDDRSMGDFCGTVDVRPGALKTDAQQLNRNLLLSSQAVAHTRPQLLILADDVKCAHGATVGQLDDNAVFYLQSRGIDIRTTQRLLTYAFAQDTLQDIVSVPMRQALQLQLQDWLHAPSDPQESAPCM